MYQSAMVEISNVPSQHFEKFLIGHLVSQIPEEEESLDIMDLGKDKLKDVDISLVNFRFSGVRLVHNVQDQSFC